jgi:hypothetical protein
VIFRNDEPIAALRPRRRIFIGSLLTWKAASSHFRLSHAEPAKDTTPLQTGHATYLPLKAVDTECRPRQRERFRKRAKKL